MVMTQRESTGHYSFITECRFIPHSVTSQAIEMKVFPPKYIKSEHIEQEWTVRGTREDEAALKTAVGGIMMEDSII